MARTLLIALLLVLAGLLVWIGWERGRKPARSSEPASSAFESAASGTESSDELRLPELASPSTAPATRDVAAPDPVRVFVCDPDERPIAGATVRWFAATEPVVLTTDGAGLCALPASPPASPTSELDLEATAPGFCGVRATCRSEKRIAIDLIPCGPLEGVVLDATNRRPIARARVHPRRVTRWVPLMEDAVTDAGGRFRFECFPLSELVRIVASADGYPEAPREGAQTPAELRGAAGELELLLAPGPSVEVQVLEYPSEVPIANALVNGTCTGADGRVVIASPSSSLDALDLLVGAEGFCGVEGSIPGGRWMPNGREVLRLPRPARFGGRVRNAEGEPVPGVEIDVVFDPGEARLANAVLPWLPEGLQYGSSGDDSVRSDGEGRYESGPCLPGSCCFEVRAEEALAGSVITTAGPLLGPGTRMDLDLFLEHRITGTVEGTVRFNGKWRRRR